MDLFFYSLFPDIPIFRTLVLEHLGSQTRIGSFLLRVFRFLRNLVFEISQEQETTTHAHMDRYEMVDGQGLIRILLC